MTIRISIEKSLRNPIFSAQVRSRADIAMRRLGEAIAEADVVVEEVSARGPGEIRCRVSARFRNGGTLHSSHTDEFPATAVAEALSRFRRRAFAELDRQKVRPRGGARRLQAASVPGGAGLINANQWSPRTSGRDAHRRVRD